MSDNTVLISVIDDEEEILTSLRWLIESVGYQVKTYSNAGEFLQSTDLAKNNCVIADVRMPKMSGLELQEELEQQGVNIPIIFMTGHGDVPMAVRAMKAGAADFLSKPMNYQMLLEFINKAVKKDLRRRVKSEKRQEVLERTKRLTPREHEIMTLMVSGKLTKIIADTLSISPNTAEVHRAKIMKKMEVRTLGELIYIALSYDLVDTEGLTEAMSTFCDPRT